MLKSLQEVKDLIIWAKSQKIARIKIGDVEFEISPYHFEQERMDVIHKQVDSDLDEQYQEPQGKPIESNDSAVYVDDMDEASIQEEEDLLFHSTN